MLVQSEGLSMGNIANDLETGAFYVVETENGKRAVWQFCKDGWYRCGDEEEVPFDWATKIVRKVRLT
jgi:hypothetical protein